MSKSLRSCVRRRNGQLRRAHRHVCVCCSTLKMRSAATVGRTATKPALFDGELFKEQYRLKLKVEYEDPDDWHAIIERDRGRSATRDGK